MKLRFKQALAFVLTMTLLMGGMPLQLAYAADGSQSSPAIRILGEPQKAAQKSVSFHVGSDFVFEQKSAIWNLPTLVEVGYSGQDSNAFWGWKTDNDSAAQKAGAYLNWDNALKDFYAVFSTPGNPGENGYNDSGIAWTFQFFYGHQDGSPSGTVKTQEYHENVYYAMPGLPAGMPVPEGKKFIGWDCDYDPATGYGSKVVYGAGEVVLGQTIYEKSKNCNWHAVWEPANPQPSEVVLAFEPNGAKGKRTEKNVPTGNTVKLPTPEKLKFQHNKHGFAGWALSSTETDPAKILQPNDPFVMERDTTFYAIWYRNAKVIYMENLENEHKQHVETYTNGEDVIALGVEDCTNFNVPQEREFLGWLDKETGSIYQPGADLAELTLDRDELVLYAQWGTPALVQYRVEHYLQNEHGDYPQQANFTDSLDGKPGDPIVLANIMRAFDKYQFERADMISQYVPEQSGVLVGRLYYRGSYTITYLVDGETYGEVERYAYGQTVDAAPVPVKEGYTFSGWDKEIPATMPAEDLVIRGTFDINSYTITYLVDNEQYGDVQSYEFGQPVDAASVPVKEGYTFSGWDMETPATMAAGNLVIRGTFNSNTYTITYLVDNEQYGDVQSYEFGQPVDAASVPVKEGYTFSGWDMETPATMPAGNLIIYGTFNINSYTITYFVDNEQYGDVQSYEFGQPVDAAPVPVKEGHTFSGWDMLTPETMPAGNLVIYGTFNSNTYTITYFVDNEQYGDVQSYEFGQPVDAAPVPVKEGHTFSGWDMLIPETMPAVDLVIYGAFNSNTYTITYLLDNEQYGDVQSYEFGQTVDAAPVPVKEGYTFNGWDMETPATMPGGNLVIRGTTSVNMHDVSYEYEGFVPLGAPLVPSKSEKAFDQTISVEDAPGFRGYVFSGWDTEDATVVDGKFQMPDHPVIFRGSWMAVTDPLDVTGIDTWYTGEERAVLVNGGISGDIAYLTIGGQRMTAVANTEGQITFGGFRNATGVTGSSPFTGAISLVRDGREIWTASVSVQIRPRKVAFAIENRTGTQAFVYDGQPHTLAVSNTTQGEFENGFGFVNGEQITVQLDANGTKQWVTGPTTVGANPDAPYLAGEGTLPDNYDMTVEPGGIEIRPRPVVLVAPGGQFVYDGTTHIVRADGVNTLADRGFLNDVGAYAVGFASMADGAPSNERRVDGTQPVQLDLDTLTLTPAQGIQLPEGVTLAQQYDMTQQPGELTVTPGRLPLLLAAKPLAKMYDGYATSVNPADTSAYTVTGLPRGVALSGVGATGSGLDAGEYAIGFAGTPIVMDGQVDVSKNYVVSYAPSKLTISRRPIHFVIGSAARVYNGQPLTVDWAWDGVTDGTGIKVGGKADADQLQVTLAGGSRTAVGSNAVGIAQGGLTLRDASGRDVTANYTITISEGRVTITPVETSYTIRYFYDGVEDATQQVRGNGPLGEVITGYPAKIRPNMRLAETTGMPLTLIADAQANVIDVYYETRAAFELIVELDTPLAGTMIGATIGDCLE